MEYVFAPLKCEEWLFTPESHLQAVLYAWDHLNNKRTGGDPAVSWVATVVTCDLQLFPGTKKKITLGSQVFGPVSPCLSF